MCCWLDIPASAYILCFFPLARCSLSHSFTFIMVASNSLLAISAFALGALAQPSVHRNLIGRAAATSSVSIPAATSWDPPSDMVEALDQVSRHDPHL